MLAQSVADMKSQAELWSTIDKSIQGIGESKRLQAHFLPQDLSFTTGKEDAPQPVTTLPLHTLEVLMQVLGTVHVEVR